MRHVLTLFRLLTLLVPLVLLAQSCHSGGPAPTGNPDAAPAGDLAAALAAIPFPDGTEVHRSTSAVDQLWVAGRNAYLDGGDTLQIGDTMVMTAGPAELTWAIYELYPGAFPLEQVYSSLSGVTVLENVWIGIANYGRHAWDWETAFEGSPALSVLGKNVVSPAGGLYLVVACWDDTSATVHKVWTENEVLSWATYALNPGNLSGETHSMAIVGGKAGVLLQDPNGLGNLDLYYYYATTELPTSADWTPTAVELNYVFPYYTLKLIDNASQPSYIKVNNLAQLWYGFSMDIPPTGAVSWNYSFVGDVTDPASDLALVDGQPAVIYRAESVHGGEKIMYARANHHQPIGPDWSYFTVAETEDPAQGYGGVALTTILGMLPAAAYWNETPNNFYYWTSDAALPTGPSNVVTTMVDSPWLGGAEPHLADWMGNAAIIYDSANSVIPRYARPVEARPETPDEFMNRHCISHMGAQNVTVVANGSTLGMAFRDYRDGSVKYAWYDGTEADLDSGADWRVVTVDERQTSGDISLCYVLGGIPMVGYNVVADSNFYLAHMVPTS